jgi:hypothetical protein
MVHTVIQILRARRRQRRRLDRPTRASESDDPPPATRNLSAAPLQGAAPVTRGHPCPPLAPGPGPR